MFGGSVEIGSKDLTVMFIVVKNMVLWITYNR